MSRKINIVIEQGATFLYSARLSDSANNSVDFSQFSVAAQVKKDYNSNTSTSFEASIVDSILYLGMNATDTANLEPGQQVYDVEVYDSGDRVTRLMEGIATVTPAVTKR